MLKKLHPNLLIDKVQDLDLRILSKNNIKGLIFDIDNTLAAHFQKEADDNILKWLERLKSQGFKFCIVSNASKERVTKFNEKISAYALHRASKPSKKSLLKAAKYMEIKPEETALVGDQIFTDVLGGNKLKMFTILVNPISEKEILFIKLKRNLEKWVIKNYRDKKGKGD